MFIIDELYKQQRGIENKLTVGSKVLSFQSASITFKDSLCLLPMPLASFLSAFNLTELKKASFLTNSICHITKITWALFLALSFVTPMECLKRKRNNCKSGTLTKYDAECNMTLPG